MNRISFENYNVEDFVSDESFINYYFQSNEKDMTFWEAWITKRPEKQHIVSDAIQIIQSFSLTLNNKEYQAEYWKITAAIEENGPGKIFRVMNWEKARRKRRLKTSAFFGVTLVAIIAAGAMYFLKPTTEQKPVIVTQVMASGTSPMILTLSDSTIVTLSPGSSLKYPLTFNATNREVSLFGEASFNVKHNEHLPFTVHAKNVVTTVLGTIFNIKKPGDSAIVVELLKGRVNVAIEDSASRSFTPILLSPNEKAVFIFNSNHFYKESGRAVYDVSFSHAGFDVIATRIKHISGKILINNSDKKIWSFTGNFKDTTPEEMIENICLIKNLHYTIAGDTIFINN